jgi:hypothetical protein
MAKKTAVKKSTTKKTTEVLVVGSKVKDVVRSAGLRSSGELIDAVSARVHEMLHNAVTRAQRNGRATVNPHDL